MEKIRMKAASFPKLFAELSHSNQFLKIFSVISLAVAILAGLLAIMVSTKDPIVLSLTPSAETFEASEMPRPEDEVRMAARAYIKKRYNWEPSNVLVHLKEAEAFVLPNSLKAYRSAAMNVARFSTEKLVEQRAYPNVINVNLEKRAVIVQGDRITSIQGLKAAGDLRLELAFETGPRTKGNPWGIYVNREREE
jgi:hypothetical protein